MTATNIRSNFEGTLNHVTSAFGKLVANAGNGRALTFPDLHKTTEGLFLSAWTYWEQFLRELFIYELATDPKGLLCNEIKASGFRLQQSHLRLARLLADHPDEDKWVEWSNIDVVKARADTLLDTNHKFSSLTGNLLGEVRRLRKIRNAIAHKSDQAWEAFRVLVQKPPYRLVKTSMQGLTTGRFLSSHKVGPVTIFEHSVRVLQTAAATVVP